MQSWKKPSNASEWRTRPLKHFNTQHYIKPYFKAKQTHTHTLSLSLMASPGISSTVDFVKKYPITLCGFSLLFMPSVQRLLLYFTPLLLSTAIFIVAMLSWGPTMSSAERSKGKRRGRPNDWAFNGSLKIYEEDEEEDEDEVEEVLEVPQLRKISEATSIKGIASKQLEPKLQEPDPDFDDQPSNQVGTASNDAISGSHSAEPDPDLSGDCVGMAFNGAISCGQAEPDPDLSGDCVGTAFNDAISCGQAEPDPGLHGDRVGAACSVEPDLSRNCVGTASYDADHCKPDRPGLHGEQHVEPAANPLHAAPDHQHHLPASQNPSPINTSDQQAAGDHPDYLADHLNYHDTHQFNYHGADQLNHVDYDDAEPNQLDYHDAEADQLDSHDAEPDPDLHGEAAVHGKSEAANGDLHAAIAEMRQKLGVMKRTPYSDDARDMHSQQIAERLQTLQAAA